MHCDTKKRINGSASNYRLDKFRNWTSSLLVEFSQIVFTITFVTMELSGRSIRVTPKYGDYSTYDFSKKVELALNLKTTINLEMLALILFITAAYRSPSQPYSVKSN